MTNITFKCLKLEQLESAISYGQFEINGLKSGQGITFGNLLRRILLNDLEGIAISAVKISNIEHEFSVIPGVREDVLEILLNLKGIILKSGKSKRESGYLKVQGPAIITANSIKFPKDIKIINPNHYIMTISTSDIIEMEFKLEYGTGYKLAYQTYENNINKFIELDSIFMPVHKVNFKVENSYDNKQNIKECLLLDIWTNGSISSVEALLSSIYNIIKTLSLFITLIQDKNFFKVDNDKSEIKNNKIKMTNIKNNIKEYRDIPIEELHFSIRIYNSLKKAQINTLSDLLKYSLNELLQLKNIGKKSLEDIDYILHKKLGIHLK